MKTKIRRGIDCRCDLEHICRYHFNRIKWQGALIAGVIILFMMSPLVLPSLVVEIIWGAVMFAFIGGFIYWFIKW